MVVLDTSIIIDHLRRRDGSLSYLQQIAKMNDKSELALAMVSVQELYEGQSSRDLQSEKDLLAIISPLQLLTYSYETAQLAGQIARDLKHPIDLADAAIAATTICNNAELLTLNQKHFIDIPNLQILNL